MARKKAAGGGSDIPEWLVTFADLMSILVCFFVLIISFSIQDKQKMQVVAGSMRDAFGVKEVQEKAGMIEFEGIPLREYVKRVTQVESELDSDFATETHVDRKKQGPEMNTHDLELAKTERPQHFASAAESLRQSWEQLPEIKEITDQILLEETEDGLHIQLLDQQGRTMFAPGSKHPYERTRQILASMAPILRALPNRIDISGHTDSNKQHDRPGYTQWELTADRANSARTILSEFGVPHDRFHSIVGRADSEPLFPDNTTLAANRRLSILIRSEPPPLPAAHRP